jgi:hypothetical protein
MRVAEFQELPWSYTIDDIGLLRIVDPTSKIRKLARELIGDKLLYI